MRVLILGRSSNAGGGPVHDLTIARGLRARGHESRIIFTLIGSPNNFLHQTAEREGFLLPHLCYRKVEDSYLRQLADLIEQWQPDWVLVDNDERLEELFRNSDRLRSRQTRVAFIAHCHVTPTNLLNRIRPYLSRVICVSRAAATLLAEYEPVVIRNAVHPPPGNGEDVRASLGIPTDAYLIGYLGRCDQNKNAPSLYAALEGTDWWCLIAGPGAEAPRPELGADIRDRVCIHPQPIENMDDFYRALDVFVLPSKSEGFPLCVSEAFLCGCRVASTRVSDLQEVFSESIGFFDYGDVVGMRNAIRCAPSPEAGQAVISRELTVERMIDQYEEALP